ncbi:MAG: hypothetical protein IJJ33_20270 [Victivallales bacterium]|nr:hypothetical protein [Victivallales bacterium]
MRRHWIPALLLSMSLLGGELFHFDFSRMEGGTSVPAVLGDYQCVSDGVHMVIEHGALRIAPAANIYVTGDFPRLADELTVSLWFLRRQQSWDTPLLMRGSHSGPIDFLVQCRYVYPAFCYKNPLDRGHWEGVYVNGPIPRDMGYGDKGWMVGKGQARADVWNHLQVTFCRGECKIYLNGSLLCHNVSDCQTLSSTSDRIYLGSERLSPASPVGYLTGDLLMNDLRLFDQALDEKSLAAIHQREKEKYPTKALKLEACNAYPPAPNYDPDFRIKLRRTADYEANVLPMLDKADKPKTAQARTIVRNGARILEIGGEEFFPLVLSPAGGRGAAKLTANVRDFAAAGVNLVNLGVPTEKCWKGIGKYDFSALDERADAILAGNPQARLMAWIMLRPPTGWFPKEFPDEIEQSWQGRQLNRNIGGGPLGSDFWLEQSDAFLTALVTHIEQSPYADRVYGYLPAGGESGEWYWPGGVYQMVTGYSPATARSFRNWLRTAYQNEAALCRAWRREGLTFDSAEVPSPESREQMGDQDSFLDLERQQPIKDFRRYMCDRTLLAIRRAAQTIKGNCGGGKLVFLYNGYSFFSTSKKLYNSGLLITEGVLETPEIDVVVTPVTYDRRRWREYGACVNPWAASTILHGKLPWQEDDPRTHFCMTAAAGRFDSAAETSEVFKRDLGLALTKNIGNWWLLFEPHWCHDETTMETVATLQRIATASLKHQRASAAQVAFLWDEQSILDLQRIRGNFFSDFSSLAYQGAFQMGAPADFLLSGDLENPALPDYKLYVMLNFYRVTPRLRAAIEAKAKKNHAVVVWCYAPGYLTEQGRSVQSMSELTGIRLREMSGRSRRSLTISDHSHPIARFMRRNGPSYEVAPAFAVDDPQATILGTAGAPALAVREYPQWRSVYSLLPLDKELLMGLCDYAGVHVYSRECHFLSVNDGFLMLHTNSDKPTTINLPGVYRVTDLYAGREISAATAEFPIEAPAGTTLLFQLDRLR